MALIGTMLFTMIRSLMGIALTHRVMVSLLTLGSPLNCVKTFKV